MPTPLLCAIAMGYGHLRPAHALANQLATPYFEVDKPPLADATEERLWARTRTLYEGITRWSQQGGMGAPLRRLVASVTAIPHLYPPRDLSPPTAGVRTLRFLAERGLGHGVVDELRRNPRPLLTTFFAPAVIADHAGCPDVYCVVTDSDVNRIWAPFDAAAGKVTYFAPSPRVVDRLRAYGVAEQRILFTGFPLPGELLGGPELPAARKNLAARLVRLDPSGVFRKVYGEELENLLGVPLPAEEAGRPPQITFAVGGAGAQADLARAFLPGVLRALREGKLRLALVAGVRPEVRKRLRAFCDDVGLGEAEVEILWAERLPDYFTAFNELLGRTDVLWSKPSEIAFFAGLGLPLVFSEPVGEHEKYNRRWVVESGAGLEQRDPAHAGEWLSEWLRAGTLAAAAWSGFLRMPNTGLYRIAEHFRG
jgi:hypothetical protein